MIYDEKTEGLTIEPKTTVINNNDKPLQRLPHWGITDSKAAFFDTESVTAIEQTARVYGKINEVVAVMNDFTHTIENAENEHKEQIENNVTELKECMKNRMISHTKNIDNKINIQNKKVNDAVAFMKDKIEESISDVINESISKSDIQVGIKYSDVNENLMIIAGNESLGGALVPDNSTIINDNGVLSISENLINKINVKFFGVKGDGTTDDYEAIQNLINTVDSGTTLFFPKGVYCISKGLVTSNKNINIEGERKGRYISKADTPSSKFGSIIKYIGTENATMITQGSGDWYLTMSNITLYSDSCTFTDNGLSDETVPYMQYQINTGDIVVNGIECIHGCQLRNICVTGMSGYGLKPAQAQNIIDCNFYQCKTCIQMENNDLMLRNCYLTASDTAIFCKDSKNLIMSDCYIDLLSGYGIYCENYLSGNITDCYIDHTNYSAVCSKGAFNNLNLDIYCGRNAMYYSGSEETDIKNTTATTELENMSRGAAICGNFMFESNIKIHAVNRPNDDAGTSSKRTPVFTLYIQQLRSGYIEGTQINKYIRQTSNTIRPVVVNANGIISSIYKSREFAKAGVIKMTYAPQSTHMASQVGDIWIFGTKIYIATAMTDTETTWTLLN